MEKKKKIGLVPKLLFAILAGILLGLYAPETLNRMFVTAADIFRVFLMFIIPLMVLAFVASGIANLTHGAGKLLGITVILAYGSTLLAGSCAFMVADALFPQFITPSVMEAVGDPQEGMLSPYFTVPLTPVLSVTSAIVLAFVLGVCISAMRARQGGDVLYGFVQELTSVITMVLHTVIIPLLPFYICGVFVNMTVSGQTFAVLHILWKVFLTVIVVHLAYLAFLFTVGGIAGKKNPLRLMRNQIPGYLTAVGTQSSAATIPVNLECAKENCVSEQIRNFVVPLCATIHMAGSMITITCCVTSVLLLYTLPVGFGVILPFILTLGVAMVAAPGAPGGAIMSTLPFLPLVGIAPDGAMAALLIALYIIQDSFGTACNVSGDNAIAVMVDAFYEKKIKSA
ncbi:MAG: Proton/glutamate-aspartate symporter [Desulfovibrio sp.]